MISLILKLISGHWALLGGGATVLAVGIAVLVALGPAAVLGMFKLVPSWCWEVLICSALILVFGLHERSLGASSVQAKWDKETAARIEADDAAIDLRREDNRATAAKQSINSINIQKVHDEEITKVHADIASAQLLRVGSAICGGIARSANTGSSSGGNGTDPGSRLVREDIGRDIDSLKLKTEEALATGRAAQAFIQNNGMAPGH